MVHQLSTELVLPVHRKDRETTELGEEGKRRVEGRELDVFDELRWRRIRRAKLTLFFLSTSLTFPAGMLVPVEVS